jgi:short-subunit dehydrogenase
MKGTLTGRTVLVTGASMGVGLSCARRFSEAGCNVVLVARKPGPLEEAAASLPAERTLARPLDVTDLQGMAALLDDAVERFGALHGLVNNAGAHFRGPVEKRTPAELATMVDVNLKAPVALTAMVLPHLRRAGEGFVVNVASLAGTIPLDGAATYSATKFGLRAFTFALAEELRGSNITVSAVSPGPIETGFILEELDEVEPIVFSQAMCTADDVADMVLACARDGRRERQYPRSGGLLATLGYLVPGFRRALKPRLEARGRKVKERLKRQRDTTP